MEEIILFKDKKELKSLDSINFYSKNKGDRKILFSRYSKTHKISFFKKYTIDKGVSYLCKVICSESNTISLIAFHRIIEEICSENKNKVFYFIASDYQKILNEYQLKQIYNILKN